MKSLRASLENIFTAHQRNCWKVMFLYLFVCPWVGGMMSLPIWSHVLSRGVTRGWGGACLKGRIHQKAITEGHFQPEGHNRRLLSIGGVTFLKK